jgi:uncharacterized SAM-binding protein YcdF (DUF218 family)
MSYVEPGLLVCLALSAIGVWLSVRRERPRYALWGLLALLVWSWRPTATLLNLSLERPHRVREGDESQWQALVVLSGSVYTANPPEPHAVSGISTYLRLQHALWLHQRYPKLPVIVSGGTLEAGVNVAELMAADLRRAGVPAGQILVEGTSRSTHENAVNVARLLRPRGLQRILLVTEAYHMLRAAASFRRQGLTVFASPCAFRHVDFEWSVPYFLPQAEAIRRNEAAVREWIAILVYRARGHI